MEIADALRENSTLTYLNLGGNKIGDEGAIAFLEVLENTSLLRLNLLDKVQGQSQML
jgi:hypothetical protein